MERDASETSNVYRIDNSPRSRKYHSPDWRTAGIALDFLHGDRATRKRDSRELSNVERTDITPRSREHRHADPRKTELSPKLHLNQRSTQSQSTVNFGLESVREPPQYNRRRPRRKAPRDVEKGEHGLNNNEDPTRLATDGEVQRSPPASPLPRISRIQGREDVTVMTSAYTAKDLKASRWTHIESQDMSFLDFKDRIKQIPGLDDDDLDLVNDLMDEIQRTSEKQFIHGRYLDPVALMCVDEDLDSKTALFVSLPAFSTEYPRMHTTNTEFQGHPLRALLQSRYRLESTYRRDKVQVISHQSGADHVVTVPQIWILMVNSHTVITWAPLTISVLLGDTIKTKSYSQTSADPATRSIYFSDIRGNAFCFTDLHFIDPQGKASCVPLTLCRTWFALLKHIVEDCLDDEFDPLKEKVKCKLLNGGREFQLVTKEGYLVTVDSWLQIMNKNRTGVIVIRLLDREGRFRRLLVNQHEEDSESDADSDQSFVNKHDRGDDATESPTSSVSDEGSVSSTAVSTAEGKSQYLASKLCGLRAKLQEAKAQVDWERVLTLSREIPMLEDRILKWTAQNLRSELRQKVDIFEEAEGTLLASYGGRQRPRFSLLETSSRSPSGGSASISTSSSRSNSQIRNRKLSIPAYDFSTRNSQLSRHGRKLEKSLEDDRNLSTQRYGRYDSSFRPLSSETRRRERSYAPRIPSNPPVTPQPLSLQSRWDTIRSRILKGQSIPQNLPIPPTPAGNKLFDVRDDTGARKRNEEVTLKPRPDGTRPALRRLVDLAHKAMFFNVHPAKPTTSPSSSIVTKGNEGLPIFLWPTNQTLSIKAGTRPRSPPRKLVEQEPSAGLFSARPDEEPTEADNAWSIREQGLQRLLTEIHHDLRKPHDPKKIVPRIPSDPTDEVAERTNLTFPLHQGNDVRAAGESYGQDSLFGATTSLVTEGHAVRLKSRVFDLASNLLHAFIPEGHDAAIVPKYWGAVHKLLRQDICIVFLNAQQPITEIVASHLSRLDEQVRGVQLGMRANDGSHPRLFQLPVSFRGAFQQLLMLFVIAGNMADLCESNISNPHFVPRDRIELIFEGCSKNLIQARTDIIKMIYSDESDGSVGSLAINSESLLSLILANLVFHSSESQAFSLTGIYRDHTTKLRSLVRNRAYVRVHDHIPLLIEELEVIKTTLLQQYGTLCDFKDSIDTSTTPDISHLSINVLDQLLENINQRSLSFEELLVEAKSAQDRSWSLKSESNNKAILVFTVTTIIFLPLSFVTSYLGMNTSDIRNMQSGQSLFWATGAPVASAVFAIALFAAFYGEITHRATRFYWRGKDKFE